jgi:glycosyltransferase involved in cell wall biosynthesis
MILNQNRKPGVSFIVRARNEEAYLARNLDSLLGLTIPHEFVVILHKCTDGSKAIVEAAKARGQPIRIFETDQDLSKAGYETLITPIQYKENVATFYNLCFSKAEYNWIFKWDADFMASPELIGFLNSGLVIDERNPLRYNIPCQMTEDVINCETYLSNCLMLFKKYIFWETPAFVGNSEMRDIHTKIYTIPHTVLKEYWKEPPWFIGKDEFLEGRYKKLVELCGPEPIGASRAQCKDCEGPFYSVKRMQGVLEGMGIQFVE